MWEKWNWWFNIGSSLKEYYSPKGSKKIEQWWEGKGDKKEIFLLWLKSGHICMLMYIVQKEGNLRRQYVEQRR